MTDDPKFKDASEGQAPAPVASEAEAETATLTFGLPDEWTVDHWQTYEDGKRDYERWARSQDRAVDFVLAGFYGAIALIKQAVVHVTVAGQGAQFQKLKNYAENLKTQAVPGKWPAPMGLVGLIWREVASKLEASSNSPL